MHRQQGNRPLCARQQHIRHCGQRAPLLDVLLAGDERHGPAVEVAAVDVVPVYMVGAHVRGAAQRPGLVHQHDALHRVWRAQLRQQHAQVALAAAEVQQGDARRARRALRHPPQRAVQHWRHLIHLLEHTVRLPQPLPGGGIPAKAAPPAQDRAANACFAHRHQLGVRARRPRRRQLRTQPRSKRLLPGLVAQLSRRRRLKPRLSYISHGTDGLAPRAAEQRTPTNKPPAMLPVIVPAQDFVTRGRQLGANHRQRWKRRGRHSAGLAT
mmetsp:Transcript_40080/g.102556  ORF Transcript_40080/g.102556 Transcript_40080/m.102556 type:complete len:268 (+) Transcript_40080:1644-2447(+)